MTVNSAITDWQQPAQWLALESEEPEGRRDIAADRLDKVAAEAVYRDAGRFLEIYERHHEAIFRYLVRRTGDRELSLDMTSQAFAQALEHLRRQPNPDLQVRPWLYRIATRVHLQHERTHRRWLNRIPLVGSYLQQRSAAPQPNALPPSALLQGLAALPEKYRTPVMLRYFEGLSFKEIALATGAAEATCRSQVHRGLERLRQKLEADDAR